MAEAGIAADDLLGAGLAVASPVDPQQPGRLPPLFIPRPKQFVHVGELPVLGTGKLDLREVKRVARDAAGVGEPDEAR